MLVSPYCVPLFASRSVSLSCLPGVVEPVVKPLSTRSANKPPVTTAHVVKDKPKDKPAGTHRAMAIFEAVFFPKYYL